MSTTTKRTKQETKQNEKKSDRPVIVPVIAPGRGYGGPGVVVLALVMTALALFGWVMPASAQETGPYSLPIEGDPATSLSPAQAREHIERQTSQLAQQIRAVQAERQELETLLESSSAEGEDLSEMMPFASSGEPMARRDTVARVEVKPPRFEGRSEIREVAYGLEEAVIECVAFRVCAIFLEPGERIVDRNLGDVDRWNYRESYAGPTGVETPAVAVQPLDFDLETNLLLFTDRRVYRLRLLGLAKPKEGSTVAFTEAMSFRYPKQGMRIAEPPPRPASTLPTSTGDPGTSPGIASGALGSLEFGYRVEEPRWRWDRFGWRPTAIFDDGERIYVYLPEAAFLDDAPLLVGLDSEDEPVQVNARLERDARTGSRYFEVPRLVGALELFVGQGDSRRWLRIRRTGSDASGED